MYENQFGEPDSADVWLKWITELARAGTYAADSQSKDAASSGDRPSALASLWNHYTHSGVTGEQSEQNAFEARQAELSYERQRSLFWETQSIPSQVQQAQTAGVNPASLYGNLAGGNVPSVPTASSSGLSSGDLLSLITNFVMQGKSLSIQRDLADAEIRLKDAQANKTDIESEGLGIDNYNKQDMYDLQKESITANIAKMKAETKDAFTHAALNNAQSALLRIDAQTRGEMNELRKQILSLQAENLEYANKDYAFQIEHLEQTYITQMAKIIADTQLANMHAKQIKEYCKTMLESPYVDKKGKEYANLIAAMTEAEIEGMMKDNRAKWVTNYVKPLSTAAALVVGSAAGFVKAMGARAAMPVAVAPDIFYGNSSLSNTMDNYNFN